MNAQDADKWITVKPNGAEHKGAHVKIDGETGEVKAGMGGKFTGQKISEVRKDFTGPKTPKGHKKPESTAQTQESAIKQDTSRAPVAPPRPDFMPQGYWNGKFYSGNRVFVDGKQKKLTNEEVDALKKWQSDYEKFKVARKEDTKTAPKQYLNVKYDDRNEAKAAGAKWDPDAKKWFWDKRNGDMPESLSRFSGSQKVATQPKPQTQQQTQRRALSDMSDAEIEKSAREYDNAVNEGGEGFNPYRQEAEKRAMRGTRVLVAQTALGQLPKHSPLSGIPEYTQFMEAASRGNTEKADRILASSKPLSDYVKWSRADASSTYGFNQLKAAEAMREGKSYEQAREIAEQSVYNWDEAMENTVAFDASSKRRIDDNGFMHVESSHITKEQVVPYRGREIPGWQERGLDPDKIYFGYRPSEELQKAVDTFNGLPIMLLHHTVSAESPKKEYQVGSMGTDAMWDAPYIDNSMIFTDAVGIRCVENGTCREISCAYQYDPDFTPGVFEGKPYDFVMRNIRGNHVAIVEEGRAGPDVVVADSSENLKPKGVKQFMSILKDFFRGAQDSDPGIEAAEVNAAQTILDLHKKDPATGEVTDVTTDEDKNAKIQQLVGQFADILSEEDLKKLEDSLSDLAYSKPTGGSEIARKMDGEDDGLNTAEAYAYGEKKEREREEQREIPGGKDATPLNTAEAVAAGERHERDKLMREHMRARAEDAIKRCGMDAEPDAVKEAFARGFEWGMHDGEKNMRNPAERAKLDREHEREGEEKRLANDAAMIKRVEDSIKSKFAAAREVERAVGLIDPLAFDSANDIYAFALDQMGRPTSDKNAARAVFRAIVDTINQKTAQDASPFAGGKKFSGSFSGLSNLKIER